MKVGDYVRTKKGVISKIIDKQDVSGSLHSKEEVFILDNGNRLAINSCKVIKTSPNIIDLIEENDFVEIEYYSDRYKERVSRIFEVDFINKNRDVCFENGHCRLNMFYGEWSNQDKLLNPIIKSIVTKEQFESMEYKVKE